MKTSELGIALIKSFESFVPDWYDDPVGVRTIGYGWTGKLPDGYQAPLTEKEASRLLSETIKAYEAGVSKAVKVPINENQFSALVSFAYNVGVGAFKSSTLLKKLNAEDYEGAALEFERWVYAGGRKFAGLVRRRYAEQDLFDRPVEKDVPVIAESDAAEKVIAAWTVTGPSPQIHREAQNKLRREWPVLADALDDLSQEPV